MTKKVEMTEKNPNSYKVIIRNDFVLKDKLSGLSRDNLIKIREIYIWKDNKLSGNGKTMNITFSELKKYDKNILVIPC